MYCIYSRAWRVVWNCVAYQLLLLLLLCWHRLVECIRTDSRHFWHRHAPLLAKLFRKTSAVARSAVFLVTERRDIRSIECWQCAHKPSGGIPSWIYLTIETENHENPVLSVRKSAPSTWSIFGVSAKSRFRVGFFPSVACAAANSWLRCDTLRYDTLVNGRSKADTSQLNLPYDSKNTKKSFTN